MRIWRQSLIDPTRREQLTSDPFGNSQDMCPLPSYAQGGPLAFLSNRQGLYNRTLSWTHYQGPGYGADFGGSSTAAAWAKKSDMQNRFYIYYGYSGEVSVLEASNNDTSFIMRYTVTNTVPADRMDSAPNLDQLLISSAVGGLYLHNVGSSNLVMLSLTGREAAFHPQVDTRITYVDYPEGKTNLEVFTADIDMTNLKLTNVAQITSGSVDDNRHPTWFRLPEKPSLRIEPHGSGCTLSWPIWAETAGFVLEQASCLEASTSWNTCGTTPRSYVYENSVFIANETQDQSMFFRLLVK